MQIVYKVTNNIEYLSKIYRWCCEQWPNSIDWTIISERINWNTGDLTVEYGFEDQGKGLLFRLVWIDEYNS